MLVFCVASLNGCFLWQWFTSEPEEKPPAQLLEEGMENMNRGLFESATQSFQRIKDRYPYSRFAVTAELKMADALYKGARYQEAYEAYNDFEKLHPKNPNIPYVIYQKGMCHFNQVKSIDRDQSHTLQAKEEFERLIKLFPKSQYTNSARRKLRECYIYLAEYELYVGHFYYKMGKYETAMDRYRYLIENYPDLGQYHEALAYLRKCKEKQGEEPEPKRWWWLPDYFTH